MPRVLWEAAARLAAEHGVAQISRELRLDYSKLKKTEAGQRRVAALGFVQIDVGVDGVADDRDAGSADIEAELFRPDGHRLVLRGLGGEQAQSLARWFSEPR